MSGQAMKLDLPSYPRRRALLVLAFAVALAGCRKPDEPAAAIPPVQTFRLEQGVAQGFRRFPGEVSAVRTSQMSFDVAGRLIERPATQGMMAKKGELLARLDPENFAARAASADARLANARDELARRRQLRERGVISASEFDQFATEFDVAQAAQREAQRALDDTRMVAPFDGRVARTLVNNFTSVQPKQPVLVFQDVSTLEIDIEVPERDMTVLGRGITADNARNMLEAKVEFPALAGQRFPLSLKSFSTEATAAARTFRVTFELQPPGDANILPGMTCTVMLRANKATDSPAETGLYEVPVQAVGVAQGGPVVWRLDPATDTVSAVPVEMAGAAGQSMRVRSDALQPGDEIVTSGVRFLSEGMKVGRMARPAGP